MDSEKSGQALCPYDPQHNSTAVFVGKLQISKYYLFGEWANNLIVACL
jgi:hypothetical protein